MVQRTPEAPRARELILSSITSRTTSSGSASPTPQQWDMIRFRCRVSVSPASIRVVASLPKPVFTPYTAASPAAARSTIRAARSTSLRAPSSRATVPWLR